MAELQTLARPYAKAAFELAQQAQMLAGWSQALDGLAALVKLPQVSALIGHPALERGQLPELLAEALGAPATPQVRALLKLLDENHRLRLLPAIAAQFAAMRATAEARIEVDITTAVDVAPEQARRLSEAVGRRLARTVEIHWNKDEHLLGGAVVRAGDLVIDGSLKGELARLSQALGH